MHELTPASTQTSIVLVLVVMCTASCEEFGYTIHIGITVRPIRCCTCLLHPVESAQLSYHLTLEILQPLAKSATSQGHRTS